VLDAQFPEPFELFAPPAATSPIKLFDSMVSVQKNTTPIPKNSNEFLRLWLTLELRRQSGFWSSASSSDSPKLVYAWLHVLFSMTAPIFGHGGLSALTTLPKVELVHRKAEDEPVIFLRKSVSTEPRLTLNENLAPVDDEKLHVRRMR